MDFLYIFQFFSLKYTIHARVIWGSRRGKRKPCLYLSLHPLTVDDTPAKLLLWRGSSGRSAGETIFRGLRKILITPVLQSKGRRVPRVRDGMAGDS